MSYVKHNYQRGDELLASQLNEMDDQIAENENIAHTLVEISNVEPEEPTNCIWVKETSTDIQIPTMGDVEELKSEIDPIYKTILDFDVILTQSGYIYSTGSEAASENYRRSGFIPVLAGDKFAYSLRNASGAPGISFYTAKSTSTIQSAYSVLGDFTVKTGTWTAPANGYIRVCTNVNMLGSGGGYFWLDSGVASDIDALKTAVAGKANASDVSAINNKLNLISGVTGNLFLISDIIIGKNSTGSDAAKRAITKAYYGGTVGITVKANNLPSNLKYEVDGYTDDEFNGLANMSGGWVSDTTTVTVVSTKPYVRILFGSVDNNNLTDADFVGLEMQIEVGQTSTQYMPKDTAVDYVARAETPVHLFSCSYNIGLYSYGISSDSPPADAVTNLDAFLSGNYFDILGLQENRTTVNDTNVNTAVFPNYFFSQMDVLNKNCIKSQFQLRNTGSGTFNAGSRPYTYGVATIGNKDVFIINVHLGLTIEDRTSNYTELLSILATHKRFICFGDFNAANEYSTGKAEQAQTEYNNLINAGYTVANGGRWGLISTMGTGTNYVDNICVSGNIKIISAKPLQVYNDMNSDHIPLVAELVV